MVLPFDVFTLDLETYANNTRMRSSILCGFVYITFSSCALGLRILMSAFKQT